MTVYPGIDISYRPTPSWRLHAALNTSLRMPSFTEMYYKLQGYKADPHLKPEEMTAIEAGANYTKGNLSIAATAWYHHGRNMIDWIMDTSLGDDAVWQSVNHAKVNSVGAEAKAKLTVESGQFTVSYSFINQNKEQEANIISQYALEYLRHKLIANAQIHLVSNLTLGVNFRWQDRVGQYTDFDGHAQDYKPYALVDTRLTWQEPKYKLYIEANNLLDTSYHDFGLVEQPGRWIIAGFNVKL